MISFQFLLYKQVLRLIFNFTKLKKTCRTIFSTIRVQRVFSHRQATAEARPLFFFSSETIISSQMSLEISRFYFKTILLITNKRLFSNQETLAVLFTSEAWTQMWLIGYALLTKKTKSLKFRHTHSFSRSGKCVLVRVCERERARKSVWRTQQRERKKFWRVKG